MKRRLVLLLVILALAAWSIGFEPGWVQQRDLQLSPANWTGQPLRIAMASDLHVGAPHAGIDALRRLVDRINAARPDLILLPGDFVIQGIPGGETVAPERIAGELARLQAPLGVFATLGNHDWWHGGGDVRQALEDAGIRVLENSAVALPTTGDRQPLWLVGIGDDMTGHAQPATAFTSVPPGTASIVMMHDPANAPELPASTLVAFAGHTHGGQVRLPFFGALIVPGRSPRAHAYGWIPDAPAPTWVSAGIGTSTFPIRFNCPPEFVILQLGGKEPT
ncbi:metallophosphoesterase [Azonexus sp. R2A61]|uniref:metallophosphoesterase n=1 Tax=Azonexus sp. R2A61 TaxID=2744443 RepID=UPI001F25E213|nr:metallophosphoesterase [Azonexus sp. R2A61]